VLQPLLDAVVDYLSVPAHIPEIVGTNPDSKQPETRSANDGGAFCALAFKIWTDPYAGRLIFFRVYSGKVTKA